MSEVIRVLDVSEFTREIDPAWWISARDVQQVRAAVIQVWGGGYTGGRKNVHFQQQVAGAQAAGLGVAAYCWPSHQWADAVAHIDQSRVRREDLAFFALDMEPSGNTDPTVKRAHVDGVIASGLKPVIYTNPSDWKSAMNASVEFADIALWLARYHWRAPAGSSFYRLRWDITIDKAFGSSTSVGGWPRNTKRLAGWQFAGTTQLGAESVDLNLFYARAFEMAEEDDMATEEEREARAKAAGVFATAEVYAAQGIDPPKDIVDRVLMYATVWKRRLE